MGTRSDKDDAALGNASLVERRRISSRSVRDSNHNIKKPTVPIAFERAADLVANELARYRVGYDVDLVEPRDNERLLAGHIAGRLWANHLLNTAGEKWEDVSFGKITPTIDEASMSKIRKTPSIGMRVEPSMDALKMEQSRMFNRKIRN